MENVEVFIINLPHRVDRRKKMEKLMTDIGFKNYKFVEPVKVDKEDPVKYPNMNKNHISLNRTVPEKIFPFVKGDHFVVFEDDLMSMVPPKEVIPRLDKIIKEVPADWDMVYLEYCMEMCPYKTEKVTENLHRAYKPYCTAGILYRKSSLADIAKCMEEEKALIDFAYVQCIKKKKLDAYITQPPLFAQDVTMQSDLNHINGKSIQYYLNFLIKMYDSDAKTSYPRLPHCVTPSSLAGYIRWTNFILFLLIVIVVLSLLGVGITHLFKSKRQ
jgi:hypothetical protein